MGDRSASKRLVVGMSGSSGPHYGISILTELARHPEIDAHLVLSEGARKCIGLETDLSAADVEAMADVVHDPDDLGASISSGSYQTAGMVVAPCSMGTLGAIASGTSRNLLSRAADVTLKERRPLVLLARETPLNLIHLRNMETVTLAGATVMPPVPAFYRRPRTIEDLVIHTTARVLDQLGISHDIASVWE